ncbi:MAG: nitrogenase molybdenum-iron protein subunit beta [Salinivirgaceae bacterium]|jgi:nitrogenase molybdenum-iron protein beta chain|nr:nitrogenase molybdenum-iron protein subunit beta [Salinivirgaceae bacterium]
MLLRHTKKASEAVDRKALTINPAKTCQPVGAMYAALGVHGCLPHSHGSQGCCSYHRTALTRHYKEPVMASTSSFTEGSSVFGGQANLLQSISNIFAIYEPEIIAVHSTCLSETIGDDLKQITEKAIADGKVPEGKHLVQASTPSYIGSHVTGYSNMVKGFIDKFAFNTGEKKRQVNLISGWVEPSDMREIKRIMKIMKVPYVMLPDTSDVLDAPMTGKFQMYPNGGTTISEMASMGDSMATVATGHFCSRDSAIHLENKCKVPFKLTDVPIGVKATDRFIQAVSSAAKVSIPEEVNVERGRLVDALADMQQYFYNKKVAVYGDPDTLIPLCEFLVDLGMKPMAVVSGTPGKEFAKRMEAILAEKVPGAKFANGSIADMYKLHSWIKEEPVDLIIGNTYGKYIARDENIPFLRYGFPILDRIGHSYFPTVGYMGTLSLAKDILNLLMDYQDANCIEEKFELVM